MLPPWLHVNIWTLHPQHWSSKTIKIICIWRILLIYINQLTLAIWHLSHSCYHSSCHQLHQHNEPPNCLYILSLSVKCVTYFKSFKGEFEFEFFHFVTDPKLEATKNKANSKMGDHPCTLSYFTLVVISRNTRQICQILLLSWGFGKTQMSTFVLMQSNLLETIFMSFCNASNVSVMPLVTEAKHITNIIYFCSYAVC